MIFQHGGHLTKDLYGAVPGVLGGDTTAPTVTLSSSAASAVYAAPFSVTATFSEDVTGFVVGDITVGNGSASNFTAVSDSVYTFDITPTANGTVTVDIAAGVCTDAALNDNTAATQLVCYYAGVGLIGKWDNDEAFGASSVLDTSGNGFHGTPTSVTFAQYTAPDGDSPAPFFDGSASRVDAYSAGIAAAWDPTKGSWMICGRVSESIVWPDGEIRMLFQITQDGGNYIDAYKNGAGAFILRRNAGGTLKNVSISVPADTNWFKLLINWDEAADEVKFFVNGTQRGATQTGLAAWVGNMTALEWGRRPSAVWYWKGGLANARLWTSVIGDSLAQALTSVS